MPGLFASAFVIARRDFTATVFSRAFLLFLLGPLFPVLMGVVFGTLGGMSAEADRPTVAVIAGEQDYRAMQRARGDLVRALPTAALVELTRVEPQADAAAQRQNLLKSKGSRLIAVLEGGLDRPVLTGAISRTGSVAGQLRLIIEDARDMRASDARSRSELRVATIENSSGTIASGRALTARIGQSLLFVLTILLAGMTLSQLIEEKSNKVIEVLAAAVPIDSIFLGKLLAMLCASLIGIAVWGAAGAAAIAIFSEEGLSAIPSPAVGWGAFAAFALLYFAMSYLLLGALFLGIGAQAATVREVQTLSMPVTMSQVVVFAAAAVAIGDPNGKLALAAAIFPLSSPYVMLARAAELPELWVHAVAVMWQLIWVALILGMASRLFRRNVLKSGAPRKRWWRRASA